MIKKLGKSLLRNLIILSLIVYVSIAFFKQESSLKAYKLQQEEYIAQIDKAEERKEELIKEKESVGDDAYIEKIAREKLGMYLPNERVYIDIGK